MIVVLPETPYPFFNGEKIGYSWTNLAGKERFKDSQLLNAANILRLINMMKEKYNITAVYILGFSQGAFLAYVAGILNHETVDGIAVFGGWFDRWLMTKTQLKLASELKIFIGHGSEDRIVNIEEAKSAFNIFQKEGYTIILEEFKGSHKLPPAELQKALKWLQSNDTNK